MNPTLACPEAAGSVPNRRARAQSAMIPKPIDEISPADIDALVASDVPEGRRLDYKEVLPDLTKPAEVTELLQDVAALANAGGGDIVFGIRERRDTAGKATGHPAAVMALTVPNPDQLGLRITNILRGNIDPIVIGLQSKFISGWNNQHVAVLRIPNSPLAPHMITQGSGQKTNSRFYMRHGAGKQPMDVSEIRSAFLRSEGARTALSRFRAERIESITSPEATIPLRRGPLVVLHLVPAESLGAEASVPLDRAKILNTELRPITDAGWNTRFNFDGYACTSGDSHESPATSYMQLFRNGCIESATTQLFVQRDTSMVLGGDTLQHALIDGVRRYAQAQKSLGLSPPLYVMVTLLGAAGCFLGHESSNFWPNHVPLTRARMFLPDVALETFESEVPRALRPIFDTIWQAFGNERCRNYDAQGNWKPSR